MGREEFMSRLGSLLSDLPADEREEALQYYDSYFNDAGGAREEEVALELGSPEALSLVIHEEVTGQKPMHDVEGEFTEQGFHNAQYYENLEYPDRRQNSGRGPFNEGYSPEERAMYQQQEEASTERRWGNPEDENYGWASKNVRRKPERDRGSRLLLIILACIFLLPVVIPTAFGLGIGLLGLVAGLWVGGIACIGGGTIAFGYGLVRLFTSLSTGIIGIGFGLVTFGIGLFLVEGGIWSSKGVAALFRGTCSLVRRIFSGRDSGWESARPDSYREF